VLEEVFDSLPPDALLGVVALVVLAFPARVPGLRPVAKAAIKSGLVLTHGVLGLIGEVGAQWGELLAEARAELGQPAPTRRSGRRGAEGWRRVSPKKRGRKARRVPRPPRSVTRDGVLSPPVKKTVTETCSRQ